MYKIISYFIASLLSLSLIACSENTGKEAAAKNSKNKPGPTLVTVAQVNNQAIEITEKTIGSLEGLIDPTIAAEVAARVVKVYVNTGQTVKQGQLIATLDATDFTMRRSEAQAEIARIQALLENQTKTVKRNQALVDKNFISQAATDNDVAQQNVLKQQLVAAKARAESINHDSSKTRIVAPVSGVVEKKLVDTGDFVSIGDPIVQIVSSQKLRAHLPFPEHIGAELRPGLKVRLTTPTNAKTVETTIHELKPMISEGNRTIDVIADVVDASGWQPGASVNGTVILSERPAAMTIPEQSLVLRPAGEVVYVVRNNTANQTLIKTGVRQNGLVEVLSGLNSNDIIVVDGAGFLTDKAQVSISQPVQD